MQFVSLEALPLFCTIVSHISIVPPPTDQCIHKNTHGYMQCRKLWSFCLYYLIQIWMLNLQLKFFLLLGYYTFLTCFKPTTWDYNYIPCHLNLVSFSADMHYLVYVKGNKQENEWQLKSTLPVKSWETWKFEIISICCMWITAYNVLHIFVLWIWKEMSILYPN